MSLLDALEKSGLIELPEQQSGFIPYFRDPNLEYQATSTNVALIVDHGFGMLTVTGKDRAKFLQNFCTNDINKLQPGDICEAFFCNVKGRILALGIILCRPDQFRILTDVTDASRLDFLHQHLERYLIAEDVDLDVDDTVEPLLVIGKEDKLTQMECVPSQIDVFPWDSGFHSALWWVGPADALVDAIKQSVGEGGVISGHDAWETVRISAGYPKYGVDISDENLAQEANRTERAISFTKGCYLGQEPIARLDAMGHVNRQLERLSYESDTPLPAGSTVQSSSGDEFGTITSSSLIPGTNRGVALAMLKVKAAQADELVAVAEDGTTTSVEMLQG